MWIVIFISTLGGLLALANVIQVFVSVYSKNKRNDDKRKIMEKILKERDKEVYDIDDI